MSAPSLPRVGRPAGARSIAEVLAEARDRLDRLTPAQALDALAEEAVLVDIRPEAQRVVHGEIPEAIVIDRNVLEWRLDPTSEAALPAARYDLQVVVICQEGYQSSLAAAALQDLGIAGATDVIGGQHAWRAELAASWRALAG